MDFQKKSLSATSACSRRQNSRSSSSASSRVVAVVLLSSLALFNCGIICAQDGTTTTPPKTPQQQALEQEITILTLKKQRAELQKAVRDALPVPSVTPLEGKTTLSSVSIEPEMMAYRALTNVAYIISGDIYDAARGAKAIAIYNAKDVKDWRFYQAMFPVFQTQMNDLKSEYRVLLSASQGRSALQTLAPETAAAPESLLGGAFIGSSLVKSFIDLTSLFRTDTEITGVSVEVNESALVAEVIHALKERYPNIKIYNPATVPPHLYEGSPTIALLKVVFENRLEGGRLVRVLESLPETVKAANDRIEKLSGEIGALKTELTQSTEAITSNEKQIVKLKNSLRTARSRAAREKIEANIQKLESTNEALKKDVQEKSTQRQDKDDEVARLKAKVKARQQDIEKNQDRLARLKALNDQVDSLLGEFLKPDATTGENAITLFVKSENLDKIFEEEAYWLEIKPVKAGGNNRTRRNLIRYLTGAKTDHSGGFIVGYALFDKQGAVKIADKYARYEGYKDSREIISWVDAFDKSGDNNGSRPATAGSSSSQAKQRK